MRINIILFLQLCFVQLSLHYSQCCPYITSVEIIPTNPSPNDSIYVISNVTTPNLGNYLGNQFQENDSNITIEACYYIGLPTAIQTYTDTINIGIKLEGAYTVDFIAYSSGYVDSCSKGDTNSVEIQFEVLMSNSIKQFEKKINTQIYPNPISNGIINVQSDVPIISSEILDTFGKLVHETNNQHHQININNIKSGIYFLRLTYLDGRTSVHKIIKPKK